MLFEVDPPLPVLFAFSELIEEPSDVRDPDPPNDWSPHSKSENKVDMFRDTFFFVFVLDLKISTKFFFVVLLRK